MTGPSFEGRVPVVPNDATCDPARFLPREDVRGPFGIVSRLRKCNSRVRDSDARPRGRTPPSPGLWAVVLLVGPGVYRVGSAATRPAWLDGRREPAVTALRRSLPFWGGRVLS